ncbi:hypothetical protein D3C77_657700 [compost metagenome]
MNTRHSKASGNVDSAMSTPVDVCGCVTSKVAALSMMSAYNLWRRARQGLCNGTGFMSCS